MAMVINQPPAGDGNCLVVWCDSIGRAAYGSYYRFTATRRVRLGLGTAASRAPDEEWSAAVDAAVVLAERNGIPTVYIVEE